MKCVSGGDADELERTLLPETHRQQLWTVCAVFVAGHPIPLTGFQEGVT